MRYVEGAPVVKKGKDGSATLATEGDYCITRTVSSIWWQENAIKFFIKDERYLIIRLGWGMLLGVELATGRVLGDAELKTMKADIDKNVLREMLLLLASDEGNKQAQGALIAGQGKYAPAIPRLRELLKSKAHKTSWRPGGRTKNEYYVRKASLDALTALGEKVDGVITEEDFP